MSGEQVTVLSMEQRPTGVRSVSLLEEHDVGHYREFRDFFAATFGLARDPFGPPALIGVEDRRYELVFGGRSGLPFPASLTIEALVPGLEPLEEEKVEGDLWAILEWVVDGVGEPWSVDGLNTSGQIFRIAPAMGR